MGAARRIRLVVSRSGREALALGGASFIAIALCSALLFWRSFGALKAELREGLVQLSLAASTQVDPLLHQALTDSTMEGSPTYNASLAPLARFQAVNPKIRFVYTCVPRGDEVRFVLDPTPAGDADGDGVEEKSHLMDRYDDASETLHRVLAGGTAEAEPAPYTDQWGTFVSAYAPLRDSTGAQYGLIGVDYLATTYQARLEVMRGALVAGLGVALALSVLVGLGVYRYRVTTRREALRIAAMVEELREARDAAEAGARAKSEFLANTSHELRTPMHGILSYARFGLREADSAERDELKDYFRNIHDCGSGLLSLLNDLLDLAKLEAGRMKFDLQVVSLVDVLDTTRVEMERWAQEKMVRLVLLQPELEVEVRVDPVRIAQVTRNLLSNAVKFSPEGGQISIGVEELEGHVVISVKDQGPGIPQAELRAVFEKFVQSSETKSGAGGTGLGLAIAREIMHAHHGRIWAENAPEGGAVFSFSLPRADAATDSTTTIGGGPEAQSAPGDDAEARAA